MGTSPEHNRYNFHTDRVPSEPVIDIGAYKFINGDRFTSEQKERALCIARHEAATAAPALAQAFSLQRAKLRHPSNYGKTTEGGNHGE